MRSAGVAYLLWLLCCVGFCGIHRFYLDSIILGVVSFLTGGIFGILQLVDLFLIPGMVDVCNSKLVQKTTTVVVQPMQAQAGQVVVVQNAQQQHVHHSSQQVVTTTTTTTTN